MLKDNAIYKALGQVVFSDVTDYVTEGRGYSYYRAGRVLSVIAQPDAITAKVFNGSGGEDYIVTFTVEGGKVQPHCTCPDARPVWCKHTIAVAMLLFRNPEQVSIVQKVSYKDVETEHANMTGLGATILNGVKLGDVIWAVENLTKVELRAWLNRTTERANADPRRHKGQEDYFTQTGEWKLM